MSPPLKFCPVPQIRLYPIAAAVVAVTYPVCSSLLCLGVKERPGTVQGVQAECGRQTMEAGLLLHVGVGFELHLAKMIPSCVADPSAPASGQGLSFLAGLGLTVRHPPYLKLVISFLFISAAVQVPLARSTSHQCSSGRTGPAQVQVQSLIPSTTEKPRAPQGWCWKERIPPGAGGTGEGQGPDTRKLTVSGVVSPRSQLG